MISRMDLIIILATLRLEKALHPAQVDRNSEAGLGFGQFRVYSVRGTSKWRHLIVGHAPLQSPFASSEA